LLIIAPVFSILLTLGFLRFAILLSFLVTRAWGCETIGAGELGEMCITHDDGHVFTISNSKLLITALNKKVCVVLMTLLLRVDAALGAIIDSDPAESPVAVQTA
jgi:hypothetical protein